jgi:hypothetical protein
MTTPTRSIGTPLSIALYLRHVAARLKGSIGAGAAIGDVVTTGAEDKHIIRINTEAIAEISVGTTGKLGLLRAHTTNATALRHTRSM